MSIYQEEGIEEFGMYPIFKDFIPKEDLADFGKMNKLRLSILGSDCMYTKFNALRFVLIFQKWKGVQKIAIPYFTDYIPGHCYCMCLHLFMSSKDGLRPWEESCNVALLFYQGLLSVKTKYGIKQCFKLFRNFWHTT